ncbi:unnamed protein product [Sphagnum jensenii]|uniref:Protein-serine/threonine phosphatase n=1 Tax=Sphagnum jensenii TaxID=128206 RepID=A0ABP0WTN7_9BRYO
MVKEVCDGEHGFERSGLPDKKSVMGIMVSSTVGCLIPNKCSNHGDSVAAALGIHYYDPPPEEGLGHSFYYVRPANFGSDSSTPLEFLGSGMAEPDGAAAIGSGGAAATATVTQVDQGSGFGRGEVPREQQHKRSATTRVSWERVPGTTSRCAPPGSSNGSETSRPKSMFETSFKVFSGASPVPRRSIPNSGPLSGPLSTGVPTSGTSLERGFLSGLLEWGFMFGPMERGVVSGPLEAAYAGHFSALLAELYQPSKLRRRTAALVKYMRTLSGPLQKALMRKMANALEKTHWSLFVPMKLFVMWEGSKEDKGDRDCVMKHAIDLALDMMVGNYDASLDPDTKEQANLQWAQGKAGEDRVHVVLSEEHGWLFVGIYDGFNGPNAPDFLMSNLYTAIYQELKGLLWV